VCKEREKGRQGGGGGGGPGYKGMLANLEGESRRKILTFGEPKFAKTGERRMRAETSLEGGDPEKVHGN